MSWLIKWLILQYGGVVRHRKVAPFFLGLILGEFTIGESLDNLRNYRRNSYLWILGVIVLISYLNHRLDAS